MRIPTAFLGEVPPTYDAVADVVASLLTGTPYLPMTDTHPSLHIFLTQPLKSDEPIWGFHLYVLPEYAPRLLDSVLDRPQADVNALYDYCRALFDRCDWPALSFFTFPICQDSQYQFAASVVRSAFFRDLVIHSIAQYLDSIVDVLLECKCYCDDGFYTPFTPLGKMALFGTLLIQLQNRTEAPFKLVREALWSHFQIRMEDD